MKEARAEAAATLRSARTEAADLLARAEVEAAATRSGAEAEGYAAGFLKARGEVELALHEQFDRRLGEMRQDVDATVSAIVEAREAMWRSAESEIAALALEIARKVIKTEVSQNPEVVGAVVKDALRRVTSRESVRIVVHPDALDQVREQRADLFLAIDNVQNLAIDSDQRVAPGGCLIETNAGCVDAKMETQLEQVAEALRG